MRKVEKILGQIEYIACMLAFYTMVFACCLQVVNRNILHLPIPWTEELARYGMIWMALLGSQIGLRMGKQMSVDFFVAKMGKSVQKVINVAGDAICCIFAGATAYFASTLIGTQMQSNQLSASLKVPMELVYMVLPISFFVMSAFSLVKLVEDGMADNSDKMGEKKEEG